MTLGSDQLDALDREYARFNASKAIGDPRESSFREEEVGPLIVTQDPMRTSSYYHRVLGLAPESLGYLDRAIALFQNPALELRIDVDESHSPTLVDDLESRGFAAGPQLVWLRADLGPGGTPAPTSAEALVRRLGPNEQDSILPFLTLGGPVDPTIWSARRHHHCTETFRAFVVEEEGATRLLVNEIAPRVHNSGHWTMDACITCQFEQHIRAILGWPLGDPARHSDVVMENLIGHDADDWQAIASEKAACLHLYGKAETRPGRKMGHVNRLTAKS